MAEEMPPEEQAAALEGFLGNPVAVEYSRKYNRPEPENRAQARRAVGFAAAQLERDIAQDEALRGLLSYCEAEAGLAHVQEQSALAYADVADKLKGILDGER